MAAYVYDFTGADTASGSGVPVPAGYPPLEQVSGSWRRLSNRAYTDTAAGSSPILAAAVGGGDVDVSANVAGTGGDAIYARVAGAGDWIRARVRRWSETTSGGYYTTEYEWYTNYGSGNGGDSSTDSDEQHFHADSEYVWDDQNSTCPVSASYRHNHTVYDASGEAFLISHDHDRSHCYTTGTTRQVWNPTSSTAWYTQVVLERAVGGSVTELGTTTKTTGTAPTTLRIRALGTAVEVFVNGSTTAAITVNDSNHLTANRHGVGRGPSDSVGSQSLDNLSIDGVNTAPNAPSNLTPSGSTTVNRDASNRFSWAFSDPDTGDAQSAYDLRYRLEGATTWSVLSGTTPNTYRDIPAGTLPAGTVEWQVRTTDAQGAVGPYSSSAIIVSASPPDDVSITSPVNGATISQEASSVSWSTTSQEAFQVRRVADDAGAADAAEVYYDSGEVTSASTRTHALTFETNGRDEHVQVRIRRTGLWSSWVSVRVTVSYTQPQVPLLSTFALPGQGAILVDPDVPPLPPGMPTFTRASTAHLDGVEVASGTPRYPYGRNLFTRVSSDHEQYWGSSSGSSTTDRATTPEPFAGGYVTRAVAQGSNGYSYVSSPANDRPAVVAGETYTGSVYVRTDQPDRSGVMGLYFYRSDGTFITNSFAPPVSVPTGVWTRVSHTFAAPAEAAMVRLFTRIESINQSTLLATGEEWWASAGQLERGSTATPWRPGGPSAVLVEEGTTNLLTVEQSTGSDWLGNHSGSVVDNASTDQSWQGGSSLRLSRAAGSGTASTSAYSFTTRPATAGTVYTLSFYVRTQVTRNAFGYYVFYDSSGASLGASPTVLAEAPAGVWTRLVAVATAPANAASFRCIAGVQGVPEGEYFWVDGVQVEARGYATSWHPGGATRAADIPRVPRTGLPAGGDAPFTVESIIKMPFPADKIWQMPFASYGRFYLAWHNAGAWRVAWLDANGTQRTLFSATGLDPSPWRDRHIHLALRFDGTTADLWVDGVKRSTTTDPTFGDADWHANGLDIGHGVTVGSTNYSAAGETDALRVSDRARTDDEITTAAADLLLDADDATTYLLRFEGDLTYETRWGEFDGTVVYPDITALDVYRTTDDGPEIHVATIPPTSTYLDRTAGAHAEHRYRLSAIGDNGTATTSEVSDTTFLRLEGVWLHPADDPDAVRQYRANADGGAARRRAEQAVRRFAGRELPVVEYGVGRDLEVSATIHLVDEQDYDILTGLLGRVAMYRDTAGRRLFGTIEGFTEDAEFYGWTVHLDLRAVDYDESVS